MTTAAVRDRWWLVVLAAVAGLLGALALVSVSDRVYETSTTYSLALVAPGEAANRFSTGASDYVDARAESYAAIVNGSTFRSQVLDQLPTVEPDSTYPVVEAAVRQDTVLLTTTVSDTDAQRALRAARVTTALLEELVVQLDPPPIQGGVSPIEMRVVEQPVLPVDADGPSTAVSLAGGLLLGALLGVAGAVLLARKDGVVRRVGDLSRTHTPPAVLGLVGRARKGDDVVHREDDVFGTIAGRLSYAHEASPRSVLVTSALIGEGKTTVATGLAVAAAQGGQRVLLVGADLRRPSVAALLSLPEGAGLSDVVLDGAPLDSAVEPTAVQNLEVLTAGRAVENPLRVLRSPEMERLLHHLTQEYDLVVVDSPAALPVADPALLATMTDTTVVVHRLRQVRLEHVDRLHHTLERAGAAIAGVVVNGVGERDLADLSSGYGNGSSAPRQEDRTRTARGASAADQVFGERAPERGRR
ncbi:CpsD/CapB family tyrosine-protein kinase [uncultured Pseudokineococcus sp.]|uniref:CpsD/CapB family tyrosine-protein kinase n=1 Tax=uncultured Pseudokineococcus sp. TaxID=1642928 RepID=UPI002628EC84|nr:CpsD/CapB family tyrosine-protein kinase [uncultured Pseudokineococcus sp.]